MAICVGYMTDIDKDATNKRIVVPGALPGRRNSVDMALASVMGTYNVIWYDLLGLCCIHSACT